MSAYDDLVRPVLRGGVGAMVAAVLAIFALGVWLVRRSARRGSGARR